MEKRESRNLGIKIAKSVTIRYVFIFYSSFLLCVALSIFEIIARLGSSGFSDFFRLCQLLLNDRQTFIIGKDCQLIFGPQPGISVWYDQLISPSH